MPAPSLARTSTFRFALLYAALFSASVIGLLAFIYWSTVAVIDQQIDDTIDAEIRGLSEQYEKEGLERLIEVVHERSGVPGNTDRVYLLVDPALRPLVGNLSFWPTAATGPSGQWIEFQVDRAGEPHQIRARSFILSTAFRILVGRDTQERSRLRRIMFDTLATALLFTLALALAGGVLFSRRLLRRVDRVAASARHIMRGDLSRRLPVSARGDEFDRLSVGLNDMLDQIETLMTGMRAVTDSLVHDLRSPLTRLRGRIEQALADAVPDDERRRHLEQALVDLAGVLKTFRTLVEIARAESGAGRASLMPVDVGGLAEAAADLFRPAAEDKGLRFAARIAPELATLGNAQLLSQAVSNLLDNAVKFTPAGGSVELIARAGGFGPELIVADTGPGIPESDRERALERFVRLDDSAEPQGSGLGLSLAAAVAKLHRGALTLADNAPGLRVTLSLPEAEDAARSTPVVRAPRPLALPARD